MATKITNQEWEKLIENEDFDTADLLSAVDAVDEMRGHLSDGDGSRPPELRTNLLRLHDLAMAVLRNGSRSQVPALFELAGDLEMQVQEIAMALEKVEATLSQLTALYPESLAYDSDPPKDETD